MEVFNRENALRLEKDKGKAQITFTPSFGRMILNKKAEEVLFGGVDFKGILIYVNKGKAYIKPSIADDCIPYRQLTRTKSFMIKETVMFRMGIEDDTKNKSVRKDISVLPEEVEGISGLYLIKI